MTEKRKTGLFWLAAVILIAMTIGVCVLTSPAFSAYIDYSRTDVTQPTMIVYNINTATVDELAGVYGLDRTAALEIVSYRERNGAFQYLEELKNVPAITEAQYLKAAGFLECY